MDETQAHLWLIFPSTSQIKFLRATHGSRLNIFVPISDLSSLSRGDAGSKCFGHIKNDVTLAGGQMFGDEYSDHVVRVLYLS